MTTVEFRKLMSDFLQEINAQRSAYIKEADQSAGFIVQTFRNVNLSTACEEFSPGLIIGFPFKSIVFENASSDSVRVKCKFNSNDQGVSYQTYGDNASVRTDKMFSKAFLFWDAQAGETIDITVYVNADYFSGALKNSGGVSVPDGVFRNDGSTFDADVVAIANMTAVKFFQLIRLEDMENFKIIQAQVCSLGIVRSQIQVLQSAKRCQRAQYSNGSAQRLAMYIKPAAEL